MIFSPKEFTKGAPEEDLLLSYTNQSFVLVRMGRQPDGKAEGDRDRSIPNGLRFSSSSSIP